LATRNFHAVHHQVFSRGGRRDPMTKVFRDETAPDSGGWSRISGTNARAAFPAPCRSPSKSMKILLNDTSSTAAVGSPAMRMPAFGRRRLCATTFVDLDASRGANFRCVGRPRGSRVPKPDVDRCIHDVAHREVLKWRCLPSTRPSDRFRGARGRGKYSNTQFEIVILRKASVGFGAALDATGSGRGPKRVVLCRRWAYVIEHRAFVEGR